MNMRGICRYIVFIIAITALFTACHSNDDNGKKTVTAKQTVLMYIPWADDSRIHSACLKNITALKTAIEYQGGLNGQKLMVVIAQNDKNAVLIDVKYKNGKCLNDTLKRYQSLTPSSFITAAGITSFFKDVIAEAPANSYGLIIGCHGMGWLPAGSNANARRRAPSSLPSHWANSIYIDEEIETRYFGSGTNSPTYQTNISELKIAIANSFKHTNFVLFDDCYMQNIETAYILKDVTDNIIASTCEVMMEGMPYASVGGALMQGDYGSVVNGFYQYYTDYKWPYATMSVVKTSKVENTARMMKAVNAAHQWDQQNINKLQILDGEYYTMFFDMGSYLRLLCQEDEGMYKQMTEQLNKMIPYKANTEYFYSANVKRAFKIDEFSGITISDPSISPLTATKETTEWWKATH